MTWEETPILTRDIENRIFKALGINPNKRVDGKRIPIHELRVVLNTFSRSAILEKLIKDEEGEK